MELSELEKKLIDAFEGSSSDLLAILEVVAKDKSVYPFNQYECLISNLIHWGGLSYEKYLQIRQQYLDENPNLWIFEISAPRAFGEKFAQTYVREKCDKLTKPSKELDPKYTGQYDLFLDGIPIEVKASRAVDSNSDQPLYVKALSRKTELPFLMNFQQLKPQCCQVFIWVAVFRDQVVLWIMSSKEVMTNPLFSEGQHRGNAGNEGQLHIDEGNIDQLAKFELLDDDLEGAIRAAAKRN